MQNGDIASVMETVAKLINLANNKGATKNEAAVAQERAESIMLKYNISQADVMSREIKEKGQLHAIRENADCFYYGKFYNWEYKMGWNISPIFDCKAVRTSGRWNHDENHYEKKMAFVGMPNDVALVLYFFDYIQNEVGTQMELAYNGMRDQNDFAMGMVSRIMERLEEMYKRVKEVMPSDCKALIVVKKDAVANRYKKEFPFTNMSRLSGPRHGAAFYNGVKAGNRVHLSTNLRQVKN